MTLEADCGETGIAKPWTHFIKQHSDLRTHGEGPSLWGLTDP
jgi:hypothetical protein